MYEETALRLKLAGIDIRVARSWFAVQLVGAGAATWFLHLMLPELSLAAAATTGMAVALGLSLSLVAHELAHARVSQRAGVEIEHIQLFAAGALCRRRTPLEHPRDQFMVAAAGPIASIAVGVLCLTGAIVAELAGWSSALSLGLGVVAFANVLIAISNLLPVFPFDGGKLVHAMFWRSTRDHTVASGRLRRSGQEFARIVTSLGILMMAFAGDLLMGLVISGFGIYLMFLPAPPSA
jgi:Zn-dependent protease